MALLSSLSANSVFVTLMTRKRDATPRRVLSDPQEIAAFIKSHRRS